MKKIILIALLFIPYMQFAQSKGTQKKLLMIVSSYGKSEGSIRPGYEFDEFSQAYLIFQNNNLLIDIASPKGGEVEADKFDKDKTYNRRVLADRAVLTKLKNTIPTSKVVPENYEAIYIVGGKGAMFDLPFDPSLQDIILDLYTRNGTVISSVCHGPAAFANISHDGKFIVEGIEMTGFTNTEEEIFGKKWVKEFSFKLEDKLKSRGAVFKQADFMLSNVAVSGKFVTGQNPFSTTRSAEAVVKLLGQEPVARDYYRDERTIYLVQDVLEKENTLEWAENELKLNNSAYDIDLIAVYGFYKMLAAEGNESELNHGAAIATLTSPYFFNENLQFMLAKTYATLDRKEQAKNILNELVEKGLLVDKAQELLKEIG